MLALKKVAIALASVVSTLVVVELLLVIAGYEYRPISIETGSQADARGFHMFEDRHFEYDPRLLWQARPGYDIFNTQGYRGAVLALPKPADTFRIFAIGDSNTLGWAGPDGPNWPALLEAELRESLSALTVTNAGVWGYASFQGVRALEDALAYEPDLVTISFGSNDAHLVQQSDADYAAAPVRESSLDRGLVRYRIGQALLAVMEGMSRPAASEPQHRVGMAEYRANLAEMIALARSRGVAIVLLTRPYIGEIEDDVDWKNFGSDYNSRSVSET